MPQYFHDPTILLPATTTTTTTATATATATVHKSLFPSTQQEVERAEEQIAQQLDSLSLEEHENILLDVHGLCHSYDCSDDGNSILDGRDEENDPVDVAITTTPAMDLFQQELQRQLALKHPNTNNNSHHYAYHRANYWDSQPSYLQSMQRAFLQAEHGNVPVAVSAFLRHWQVKEQLFGEGQQLARPILWHDLSDKEREILRSGRMQRLSVPDAAGRTVLLFLHRPEANVLALARCHWYFLSACLEEQQQSCRVDPGIVIVFCLSPHVETTVPSPSTTTASPSMDTDSTTLNSMSLFLRIHASLPERVAGVHVCCCDQLQANAFVTGLRLFLAPPALPRFRIHRGTRHLHWLSLEGFGLPTTPLTPYLQSSTGSRNTSTTTGSWETKDHLEWLQRRRHFEDNTFPPCLTTIPRPFDVLFGQQKSCRMHTGTLRALHLVHLFQPKYEASTKYQKLELADRIVAMIHDSQGRFLRPDPSSGQWVLVGHDHAREKISHFFRYNRSKRGTATSSAKLQLTQR
eukprot:Nitzschia sp. Nitz4//scaffold44_size153857//56878//58501//NITZ4_002715-RA/size153857-augustus-gene-0.5-mRNA-1//1//CDS//3329552139//7293//frame0